MPKIEIAKINTPLNSHEFQAQINRNFEKVSEALDKQLQREPQDGVVNYMEQEINMGNHRIINLAKAVDPTDAMRKKEFDEQIANIEQWAQEAKDSAASAAEDADDAEEARRVAVSAAQSAQEHNEQVKQLHDELLADEYVPVVAENIADVKTVAADIDNVNTTATNIEDIKAVFDIAKRICYGNIGDISATAANIAPDGCRFLDGATITREEFPDAFKMLDEGTLPAKSVEEWNKAGIVRTYTLLGNLDPAFDEAAGWVKSSGGFQVEPIEIPTTFSAFRVRTSFKTTTIPSDTDDSGYFRIFSFAGGVLEYSKQATAVVDGQYADFKYTLNTKVSVTYEQEGETKEGFVGESYWREGAEPIIVLSPDTVYVVDYSLYNSNGVWRAEYSLYDSTGTSLIATRTLEMNSEELKQSHLLDLSTDMPYVLFGSETAFNISETKIWLDSALLYKGTPVVFTGNNPFFGFDEGSDTALLPVAKDVFLEASDVHAAWEAAGLPNIIGEAGNYGNGIGTNYYSSGAMYVREYTGVVGESENTQGVSSIYGIDASRSSPIYGKSSTVQPEALKYRHYIVLSHREQMIFTMRESVKAYKDLPKTNNINGDIRMVTDQGIAYIWCRYSRDVWGWSSIGQYLTITAPGKFAWGALGGDLRAQTDLYSRLNVPALAVAGEGIKFEEEKEQNYVEAFRTPQYSGTFTYSEDGKRLLGVPRYGYLLMDKVDLDGEYKASFRIKFSDPETATTARRYFVGLGASSYISYTQNTTRVAVSAYLGTSFNMPLVLEGVQDYTVDFVLTVNRPEQNKASITLAAVDLTGNVLSSLTKETTWNFVGKQTYLGNRQTGAEQTLDLDLTNTWMEQNGIRYYALRVFEEPRTKISVEDFDKLLKNASSGANLVVYPESSPPTTLGSLATMFGQATYVGKNATTFGYLNIALGDNSIAHGYDANAYGASSIQIGTGDNFTSGSFQIQDTPILLGDKKIVKERLPLVAGEGISFVEGSPKKPYAVVGAPTISDNLLTLDYNIDEASYIVSDALKFNGHTMVNFDLQVAFKNIGIYKGSSSSTQYSGDTLFYMTGISRTQEGTYNASRNIFWATITEQNGLEFYGLATGGLDWADIVGKDLIIRVRARQPSTTELSYTLDYSLDDGASFTVLRTNTVAQDSWAFFYYPVIKLGRCNAYYSTYGQFTGAIDLNKTFFSNESLGISFYPSENKESNELVVSVKEPAMPVLTAADEATVLSDGIYKGREVTDKEVFTSSEGGFKKASKELVTWNYTGVNKGSSYEVLKFKDILFAFGNSGGLGSTDGGATWTITPGLTTRDYAATNGEILVAAQSAQGYIGWTTDGRNWTQNSASSTTISKIVYGNGIFIAVSSPYLISSDGKTWEAIPLEGTGLTYNIQGLWYDGEKFVTYTNGLIYTSTDGRTWTEKGYRYWNYGSSAMAFKDGVWYGTSGTSTSAYLFSSTDLKTWTKIAEVPFTSTLNNSYLRVSGDWFILSKEGEHYCSKDTITWKKTSVPAYANLGSIFYIDGKYFAGFSKQETLGLSTAGLYVTDSLAETKTTLATLAAGNNATADYAYAAGEGSTAEEAGTAIGYNSSAMNYSVSYGFSADASGMYSVAYGASSQTTGDYSTAIGYNAHAMAEHAIQIGYGNNTEAHTMRVALDQNNNLLLLDENGDIPAERTMNGLITIGSGAPTTATEGFYGKVYIDSTNKQAYICVYDAGTSWTWKQITA